jgi:pantoate--beta-alanine ligase
VKVVADISDVRRERAALPGRFGLVPTMGALHEGHLSLVRRARAECDAVGLSIFVNPTQFGPGEDLSRYPRDLDADLMALEPLGVDLVWTPSPEVMYPPAFQTWVMIEEVSKRLEGERRPGHFRGVATVVAKLFNVFAPDRAYFGQKDAQQTVVIRRMVEDLSIPTEIVICPTVRAPDGLALSSRNSYLNPGERQAATVLFRALSEARAAYLRGERHARVLRDIMKSVLGQEPLARVDYVSVADPETLVELEQIEDRALVSLAVYIGRTRLIDNTLWGSDQVNCYI